MEANQGVVAKPNYHLYATGLIAGAALATFAPNLLSAKLGSLVLELYSQNLEQSRWQYLKDNKGQEFHNRKTLTDAGLTGCMLGMGIHAVKKLGSLPGNSTGLKVLAAALAVMGGSMVLAAGYSAQKEIRVLQSNSTQLSADGAFFQGRFAELQEEGIVLADGGKLAIEQGLQEIRERIDFRNPTNFYTQLVLSLPDTASPSVSADDLPLLLPMLDESRKGNPQTRNAARRDFVNTHWNFFLKGEATPENPYNTPADLAFTYSENVRLSILRFLCNKAAECQSLKQALLQKRQELQESGDQGEFATKLLAELAKVQA